MVLAVRYGAQRWPVRVALTVAVLAVVVLLCAALRRGWHRRVRRDADLPVLPRPPATPTSLSGAPVELAALYVGTTAAGDWLERVLAHGLGRRRTGTLRLTGDGLTLHERGGDGLFVPTSALRGATVAAAHAGKVMGAGGLLVVTWEHGGRELASGFRADDIGAHGRWARALSALASPRAAPPANPSGTSSASSAHPAAARPPASRPPGDLTAQPAALPTKPEEHNVSEHNVSEHNVSEHNVSEQGEPGQVRRPTSAAGADPRPDPRPDPLSMPLADLLANAVEEAPVLLPEPAVAAALVGRARRPALLALEDGRVFAGQAFGAVGESFGEAVFATGMTGYQETLTDPSYHRQVLTMTAPHIGNTGVNDDDPESDRIWVAGLVVRDPARRPSSHRSKRGLPGELERFGVVGVGGVDTRAVTRHLRERGAMRCAVSSTETDPDALVERVRRSPSMVGADLARAVSTTQPYVVPAVGQRRLRVAALDLGIKRNTPRSLALLGVEVHVLPATSTAADLLAVDPDGIFVSNGPGDPAATPYAVEALAGVLGRRPVFGICMGNQMLGRALGLGTYKLRYGHRGVNQPVRDRRTGKVAITSHNHGFAVQAPLDRDTDTPFGRVQVSHVDLNDGVVEGLRCLDVPAFSVQYHPEAAPGPHDAHDLFEDFVELMATQPVRA